MSFAGSDFMQIDLPHRQKRSDGCFLKQAAVGWWLRLAVKLLLRIG